jgi:antitoxin (DNA-binding transcriptional repressor) of toxin-antitoxin stability system
VSKAELSELVELASRGEEAPISVRGKVKARLTRAAPKISAEGMLAGEGLTG